MKLHSLVLALTESRVLPRMINYLFTDGGSNVLEEVCLREVRFGGKKKKKATLQLIAHG